MYIHKEYRTRTDEKNIYNDYIVLADLDFSWKEEDVDRIVRLINRGATIETVAGIYTRHPEEVFLLLLDLARKGKINPEHNIFELKEE